MIGVNDDGDLNTDTYTPNAAAGMRARAAGDDVLPVGKVDTTIDKWAVKMVRDVGATYTITVGEVVWESTIGDGEVVWKLKQGTPDQAKAALLNIDSAVVEKIAMAPVDPPAETGTVSVSVKKPLQATNATMKIKAETNGVVSWEDASTQPIADGVVNVTVKYEET